MNAGTSPRSRRRRTWRRATCVAIIGTIGPLVAASTASAEPPYEPNDTYNGTGYPDDPGYWTPTDDDGTTHTIPELDGAIASSAGADTVPSNNCYDDEIGTDIVKLTGPGVDFGDRFWVWFLDDPAGPGSVRWTVECGFFSARVQGTLHLDESSGLYGQVGVSFRSYGEEVEARYSPAYRATSNGHHQWSVDLSPTVDGVHITDVVICTYRSVDAVVFTGADCKTRFLG
jgi:hypothetical protein